MKVLAALLTAVVVAAVAITETAIQPAPAERPVLYGVFGGLALSTGLLGWWSIRQARRLRSLRSTVWMITLATVGVAVAAVAVSAATMFLSAHDLRLVAVALALGVGLGVALAVAVARPLEVDLRRLAEAVDRVGDGDLAVRTGIRRADEVGAVARAMDDMVERLAEAQRLRERQEEARRAFLAAVGHDLRTPLTALQASVEALQDGIAPEPDRYLQSMSRDLALLRGLVDDVFMLARIEAGDVQLSLVPVDLAELADEAVEAMSPVARRRGLRIELRAGPPLVIAGDPQALSRALRNLLDNALRHAPDGSAVTVSVRDGNGSAVVTVADEGPGFPAGFGERALDSFTRADSARVRDGSGGGLGLAIVKGLVEAHGGAVRVEDGPGGRVAVQLPLGATRSASG